MRSSPQPAGACATEAEDLSRSKRHACVLVFRREADDPFREIRGDGLCVRRHRPVSELTCRNYDGRPAQLAPGRAQAVTWSEKAPLSPPQPSPVMKYCRVAGRRIGCRGIPWARVTVYACIGPDRAAVRRFFARVRGGVEIRCRASVASLRPLR